MKHPLKLLFVLPAYEPAWSFGGVVRCMSNLCRGLAALGHEITVYTINTDGCGGTLAAPSGQAVAQGGVSTYFFPSTFGARSVFDSRALVNQLRRTIRAFDLVYLSAIWQWLGAAVSSICAQYQVPLVIGTHGSFDKTNFHKKQVKKMFYWYLFLKRSLEKAAALHFTTLHEHRESQDLLANFKYFIVPNSLDCDAFRPMKQSRELFRNNYGIPMDAPLVITVGRADPAKRYDLLIRALAVIPQMYLLVVGPETCDLTRSWQDFANELKVSDRIIWTGNLAGDKLLRAYGAADIFSLISNSENFAMVVVEAMACGLPVLINPEVGVSEFLEKTEGIMIIEKTSQAVTEALQTILSQPERWGHWSEINQQAAHHLFAKEKVAAVMAQEFEALLSRP
jgi:glycosyltransferase involved in cell wall biosynthesis